MGVDVSQLRELISDLDGVPREVTRQVPGVVKKGAMNVKKSMQSDFRGSRYFGQIARSINFDVSADADGFEAEIGPDKSIPKAGGALAVIAYWGGANGGGGTVRDPAEPLLEEAPRFEQALSKLLDGVL